MFVIDSSLGFFGLIFLLIILLIVMRILRKHNERKVEEAEEELDKSMKKLQKTLEESWEKEREEKRNEIEKKLEDSREGLFKATFSNRLKPEEEEKVLVTKDDLFVGFYEAYQYALKDYKEEFGEELLLLRPPQDGLFVDDVPPNSRVISFKELSEAKAKAYQHAIGRANMPASFIEAAKSLKHVSLADVVNNLESYGKMSIELRMANSAAYEDTQEFRNHYSAIGFGMAVVDLVTIWGAEYSEVVRKWNENPNPEDPIYDITKILTFTPFAELVVPKEN